MYFWIMTASTSDIRYTREKWIQNKSEHAKKTNINILNQITSISNYKFLYYFGLPQFKSSEQQMTQEHSPHTNWTQK